MSGAGSGNRVAQGDARRADVGRPSGTEGDIHLPAVLAGLGSSGDGNETGIRVVRRFSGFCAHPANGPIYFTDVLQKSMLGLEETGVEAAAATAVFQDAA